MQTFQQNSVELKTLVYAMVTDIGSISGDLEDMEI